MIEWIQATTADWDWATFWPELLGKAAGVLTGILLSWFLLIRRRLKSMNRLRSGDSDDVLFQAHYLHPLPETADASHLPSPPPSGVPDNRDQPPRAHYQLLFRNVAEKQTVPQIYDNPAAAELVKSLGDETSLNQPILPTQDTIGFEVINDAASWMSGASATSANSRDVWLFCMTAEDRQVVRKRCVRCFLIRPADLKRFHDWDWCRQNVTVERPWHWFRIVALHRVARLYADQCRMYSVADKATAMPLVDAQAGHRRIMALSLGLIADERPVSKPVVIDWDLQSKSPLGSQLTLQPGAWPDELVESA
ncbi:hypothetical protein SAMN06265222_114127 [Neorhodopirellula lusitana]|uniref:Uncharacterized protein n=1 Tax=Neorhodopirellula lusitana TaxID=445327 RepID=A0ABY1QHQ1_9BACT|nr:hypothetical protein [Neorhodopirellula lusitana]SMP71857.1 hypothetical protein SAMN06265222_114127 [Neorhodopirellula lusitana]